MELEVFRNRLIKNCVALNNEMTCTEMIIDHLVANREMNTWAKESIMVEPNKYRKNDMILCYLRKRPQTVIRVFLDALCATGQQHLADLIDPPREGEPKRAAPVKLVFNNLKTAVSGLKPAERQSERSALLYLTSTTLYSDPSPVSSLGVREIPFLFAVKSGFYGVDVVLGWKEAPTKADFERAMNIYNAELSEIEAILNSLENGGFELILTPRDDRLYRFVMALNKPYLTPFNGSLRLCVTCFQRKQLSPADFSIMCAAFHLMCFGTYSMVIRKTITPKPNSYLLYNAYCLLDSQVIMPRDIQWVRTAVDTDESVVMVGGQNTSCPW